MSSDKIWFLVSLFVMLVVVHELIHGITWGCYTKDHFKSIDFGIIWAMLTLYCTCKTPLKKSAYIVGSIMPMIVLGFIFTFYTILINDSFLFLLAELKILSGRGGS